MSPDDKLATSLPVLPAAVCFYYDGGAECRRNVGLSVVIRLRAMELPEKNRLYTTTPVIAIRSIRCPYCGESFETGVDSSGGSQEYIEDCYVCCRPIVFRLEADADGNLSGLEARREDD